MKRHTLGRRSGFTLIEVMIVIAIILAIGSLVGIALFQRRDEAKVNLTKQDMNTLKGSISLFYMDFDRVPTTEEGLPVLWSKTELDDPEQESKWKGYTQKPLAKDRWDNEWGYEQLSRTSYRVWSVGPDGEEGSEDDIEETASLMPGEDVEGMESGSFADELVPTGGN